MIDAKWIVVTNDGDKVVLNRETEEAFEEAELKRPDGTDANTWLALWPVGASYTVDDFEIEAKRAFSIMPPSIHAKMPLRDYARALYLQHASQNPEIAKEYLAAISGGDVALMSFVEKVSDQSPEISSWDRAYMLSLAVEKGLIPARKEDSVK